jgi:hypothetical protein
MNEYMCVQYNSTTGVSIESFFFTSWECEDAFDALNVPAVGGWVGAFLMTEGVNKVLNQGNSVYWKD